MREALGRAGVGAVPGGVPEGVVPAVVGYGSAEVSGGVYVRYADPRLVEALNGCWYRLAVAEGLFGEGGDFLLMPPGGEGGWRRVRLLEGWDLMGAGAETVLGAGAGRPDFTALALDGGVAVVAASYAGGAGVHAVRRPGSVTGRKRWG
ncbi:hypothetical protein QEZ40_007053 [Streptomyces katrae]|uniref:Uncharacterized protein n=1 Tax=Streptomyces katrae TaxID=68223 RepID=A0ABT7GQ89_9ACTN|nr:hypothetical protein [Streptomyces katrae]MDK9495760.1 hypothetical protein [Streptomyces katrae]